jgi:hypothetical protein
LAPDHRVAVAQLDAGGGDLVEAVEGSAASGRVHAASLAVRSFHFQGRSSASLAARVIVDPGKDIGEPGLRIDAVELGRFDQREHRGGALATAV